MTNSDLTMQLPARARKTTRLRELAKGNGALTRLKFAQQQAQTYRHLNALAHVDWDAAAIAATIAATESASLPRGRLQGILISLKDLYRVQGMPCNAGTLAPLPELGVVEGSMIKRLRAEGAILFAKTNMHEIALGATGENSWTGDVLNPYQPSLQAGGSSSGSGVAVACGIGDASVGSDTGGSVRIPAAFSGVVGFKPSFGAVPLDGALHLSWTCDHAGPLTNSVDDARLMFEVMSAQSQSLHSPESQSSPRRVRLGVARTWDKSRLSPAIAEDFAVALKMLEASGIELVDIEITQAMQIAWQFYTPIVRAEAAWVHRQVLANEQSAVEVFSSGVLAPLTEGKKILAVDYLDAMRQRETGRAMIDKAFMQVDALITPTTAIYAPARGQSEAIGAGGQTVTVREAVLGQTLGFSSYGLPAISLPYWQAVAKRGLPLGLQLVSSRGTDFHLLDIAETIESIVAIGT